MDVYMRPDSRGESAKTSEVLDYGERQRSALIGWLGALAKRMGSFGNPESSRFSTTVSKGPIFRDEGDEENITINPVVNPIEAGVSSEYQAKMGGRMNSRLSGILRSYNTPDIKKAEKNALDWLARRVTDAATDLDFVMTGGAIPEDSSAKENEKGFVDSASVEPLGIEEDIRRLSNVFMHNHLEATELHKKNENPIMLNSDKFLVESELDPVDRLRIRGAVAAVRVPSLVSDLNQGSHTDQAIGLIDRLDKCQRYFDRHYGADISTDTAIDLVELNAFQKLFDSVVSEAESLVVENMGYEVTPAKFVEQVIEDLEIDLSGIKKLNLMPSEILGLVKDRVAIKLKYLPNGSSEENATRNQMESIFNALSGIMSRFEDKSLNEYLEEQKSKAPSLVVV